MNLLPENPISNLTDEQKLEAKANYLRLFSFLNLLASNMDQGITLVSRGSLRQMTGLDDKGQPIIERIPTAWESTGIHTDGESNRIHAKVGNHQFQAIGWFYEDMIVLSDTSKVLWEREFAFMQPTPTAVPFKAEEVPIEEGFRLEKEDEKKRLEENLKELDELYETYLKAYARKDTRLKVYEKDLRAGIHMASMQVPSLDAVIKNFVDKNPTVYPSLDGPGADMKEIAPNVLTWMKVKIQNIEMEIHQRTIQLIPQETTHPAVILLQSAEKVLLPADREAVIRRYWKTFPETLPQTEEVDLDVVFPQMVEDLRKRLEDSSTAAKGDGIDLTAPKEDLTLASAKDSTFCGQKLSEAQKAAYTLEAQEKAAAMEAARKEGVAPPPEPT